MIPAVGLALLGALFVSICPESPKFLISQHKYEEARASLNIIGYYNKREIGISNGFIFKEEIDHMSFCQRSRYRQSVAQKNSKNVSELFSKNNNMGVATVVWVVIVFNLKMLSFQNKELPGNMFQKQMWLSITDLLAGIITGIVLSRFRIKKTL